MPYQEVLASEIGQLAWELLSQPRQAQVMGKTSRGLFLHLPPERLVFISLETFHGPLTLNLCAYPEALERVGKDALVRIVPGQIYFPDTALTIFTSQAAPWKAPDPVLAALPFAQRRERLAAISQQLLALRPPSLIGGLLPGWLKPNDISNPDQPAVFHLLAQLGQALRAGQLAGISDALVPWLGLGSGLTPSGDDLICGFLLALNRWGEALAPSLPLPDLNQSIRAQAYRKTTLLSASLIDCACQGQGDERLLQALDGIMTGAPGADACVSLLAQWGNSSGLDALVGMALAINAPGSGG